MAKKVFVSAALLLSSCALAWGQTGTYSSGDNTVEITANNSTLTINVTGDATKMETEICTAIKTAIAGGNYSTITVNGGQINSAIVHSITHSNLTTIDLGNTTVQDFSQSTFTWDDVNLQTITLPLTIKDAEGKMTVPEYALNAPLFNSNSQITKVIIPEGYTNIGDRAFYNYGNNQNLNVTFTVTLPSTLKEIGTSAFEGALQMTDVILPEGLETIGKRAFWNCNNLTDPKFPSTLKEILSEAYYKAKSIKNIVFNESIEFIGNSAFYLDEITAGCQNTIIFPNSLKYIGPGAFMFRRFTDIYFNSERAPLCPIGKIFSYTNSDLFESAFEDCVHMGNVGFTPSNKSNNEGDIRDDITSGYANRENYKNNGVYFTMLHFPKIEETEIGKVNAETYTDITREYTTKFNSDGTFHTWPPYKVGKEEINLKYRNLELNNEGKVDPGYIDTYRGEQYIWPSQSQWKRSFVCNSLGYNWDGVTEYRPTLTDEHIKLMIKDGLTIKNAEGNDVVISEDNTTFTYNDITAAEHNATLPGAVTTNTVRVEAVFYTQKEADDHNAELDGAIKEGDEILYTNDEVNQHNAELTGAVKAGDIQTEGHDDIYYGEDEYEEYMVAVKAAVDAGKIDYNTIYMTEDNFKENLKMKKNGEGCWEPVSFIKDPKTETIYYTEETANEYNLNLDGAWQYDKVKGIATAETAKEYNRTLLGAWTKETIKTPAVFFTAEEANTHNAELTGAVKAGMTTSSAKAYADELSMTAYMGTRQFVLADGNIKASNEYPIDVKGGQWWTICVPFNMTKNQIDEVFGEGTHVCLFSDVERHAEGSQKKITLKFVHDVYAHNTVKDADGKYATNFYDNAPACGDDDIVIYAHESYMIYPTKTDKDAVFVVKNYEPIAGSPLPTIVTASDGTEYRFIGNYTTKIGGDETRKAIERIKTITIPQYSYMYAQKKGDKVAKFWFYSGTTMAWKANKCVVQATAKDGGTTDFNNFFGDAISQAKQISIFGSDDIDDKPTEIEHVEIIAGEQPTNNIKYDLYGRRVSDDYKGIYIMNGKKYINR